MAPPFIDPRANLKTAEESDEEVSDAPAAEDPVTDWVNNLNKFKTVGKDIMTVKASDLEKKEPMARIALCSWRAHVYDVASAFDAIVNPTAFEGGMRQLMPEHTEELMPYIDTMYMSLGQPRGMRELECDQLYGLCTSYQGVRHPVPPPVYNIPTVRLYLVGDSTLYTQSKKGRVSWHNRIKTSLGWNVRGDAMWGKGLVEFNEAIRSYLTKWSVEEVIHDDTVSQAVDPMGN